jgi:uncharacterized protein YlxW (UPF0749 family)
MNQPTQQAKRIERDKKQRAGVIALLVVCFFFGFSIMLQVRSVKRHTETYQNPEYMRVSVLQAELEAEITKREKLYNEILELKDEIAMFRDQAASSGSYASVLTEQLNKMEILAGTADVEGPGLIVTLDDSKVAGASPDINQNYFVIHDSDLLAVINELNDAGAEAVSINDERLLSNSEIRCAGSIVSVNNNRYAVPFVIRAIGDPDTMEAALMMRGGVYDMLRQWNIEFKIEKSDHVVVKGYKGAVRFNYALPVKSEGVEP